MIGDIGTVMWKEIRALSHYRGSRTRALLSFIVPIAVVAVWFPLQMGLDWLEGWLSLFSLIVPMIIVMRVVPDSFAGERERHTLETLLASRLPDRAIFLGKLFTAVCLGFGMTLLALAFSLITVNIAHWQGHISLYAAKVFLIDLAAALVVALLVSSAGILLSLRASTVQEAAQTLGALVFVPPFAVGLILFLLRNQVQDWLAGVSFTQVILGVVGLLLASGLALLFVAMQRFQRNRLILS